jgi:cobalt-zinc-cadmium efflux system outer membrane protein
MFIKRIGGLAPWIGLVIGCFAALVLGGCALQKYRAAPISPAKNASSLEARSLLSPGLRDFAAAELKSGASSWPPARWDLAGLTLAAFYYNPSLATARARVAEADAAIVTARTRPNPTLSADVGGETAPESPWLAGIGFSLPIETAGKRGYRTSEAQLLANVSRWDLAAAAWKVRSAMRSALIEYLGARQNLDALRSEAKLRTEQVALFRQRLAAGMIPQPEVDSARIQQTRALLAVRAGEGRVSQASASMAEAVGVPVRAIDSIRIAWPAFDELPASAAFSSSQIQVDAVLNRLDVRRALAVYSAAEKALQLEIAKQYPNFDLGTSYAYEEGSHLFSVPLTLTIPIFNRNQGPIAEAKARRQEMAANFLAVQAAGIANSEKALANYSAALAQLAEARRLLQQSRAQEAAAQKALIGGLSDRVALNGAELQTVTSRSAELAALYKAQQALGALEDAVQRPLLPGDIQPLTSASSLLNPQEGKSQ